MGILRPGLCGAAKANEKSVGSGKRKGLQHRGISLVPLRVQIVETGFQ